ncbi:MAG: hypothetical protein JRM94_04765 [Nitrososphaerota archaeon]|nr:hypothetical protein [Nitrososphaerota archaeon]
MPKFDVPNYGLMTRDEKRGKKELKECALLFDGKFGAYRRIRVYVCKCGLKFRDASTFRFHAARRHESHLPYDTDYIPCLDRMEWMSVRVRRKVF